MVFLSNFRQYWAMRVALNDGVRLYVDVDGLGLVPIDGKLQERPTLILLHGGPGIDHASYKLGLVDLRDVHKS